MNRPAQASFCLTAMACTIIATSSADYGHPYWALAAAALAALAFVVGFVL